MLFEAGRDTAAMFALDNLLCRLREDYVEQVLTGLVPNKGFWPEGETAAKEEIKKRFYNRKVREAVKPSQMEASEVGPESPELEGEKADKSDEKANQVDFDQHGQKLTEHAIWMTHEIIKQIPYVGQEEYKAD